MTLMYDVLIIGGGVIGLSLAVELAQAGQRVQVVDRQSPGREASWAGAGMIPPGEIHLASPAYRQLAKLSAALWPELSARLLDQTGIDNEYHCCGAVITQPPDSTAVDIHAEMQRWREQGEVVAQLSEEELRDCWPGRENTDRIAYCLPGQAQVRNPRHLRALLRDCELLGVRVSGGVEVQQIQAAGERVRGIETNVGRLSAGQYVCAAGAWSGQFAADLHLSIPVQPVRGKIALVQTSGKLRHIIEQGKRYLVPRRDGRLLIGSTEEQVAFERQVEPDDFRPLLEFGRQFLPELADLPLERGWCGFRPATPDRLPILGRHPGLTNLYLASGHYRAGLSLSPATSQVVAAMMDGRSTAFPVEEFAVDRFEVSSVPTAG